MLLASSNKVLTRNALKNKIKRNAIIGEISIPILKCMGKILLIGSNIGSVAL
jgi:hypothetical protein